MEDKEERLRILLRSAMDHKAKLFHHTVQDTKQIFGWMDTDHSGALDPKEFRWAIISLGLFASEYQARGLHERDIEGLWQLFDADDSGFVNLAEVVRAMHGDGVDELRE